MLEIDKNEIIKEKKYLEVGFVGTIGAGKTELSGLLGKRWGIEPIEEKYPENPFLANFYNDPFADGASFKSQFWFMTEKIEQLKKVNTNEVRIIDPSLVMDRLYAKTHHQMGYMKDEEWNLYRGVFETLTTEANITYPDMFVVVTADIDVLIQRIVDRGRPYEKWLLNNKDYLVELQKAVEEWGKTPEKGVFKLPINTSDTPIEEIELNAGRVEGYICREFGILGKHVLPNIPAPSVSTQDIYVSLGNESVRFKR
jgi:deoxyadenosine/deoxycytidine kinase